MQRPPLMVASSPPPRRARMWRLAPPVVARTQQDEEATTTTTYASWRGSAQGRSTCYRPPSSSSPPLGMGFLQVHLTNVLNYLATWGSCPLLLDLDLVFDLTCLPSWPILTAFFSNSISFFLLGFQHIVAFNCVTGRCFVFARTMALGRLRRPCRSGSSHQLKILSLWFAFRSRSRRIVFNIFIPMEILSLCLVCHAHWWMIVGDASAVD